MIWGEGKGWLFMSLPAPQTMLACDSFKIGKNDFSTQCVIGDSVPQDTAGADSLQRIKRRLHKSQIDPLKFIKWIKTFS